MEQSPFKEASSFSNDQEILQGLMTLFTWACHWTLEQPDNSTTPSQPISYTFTDLMNRPVLHQPTF